MRAAVEGFHFGSVSSGPGQCSDGCNSRCLKMCIYNSEEKHRVEKESSRCQIIEAVTEVDQKQSLEIEEIGARTEDLGNRVDKVCVNAETWKTLRCSCSRAKRQTRGMAP